MQNKKRLLSSVICALLALLLMSCAASTKYEMSSDEGYYAGSGAMADEAAYEEAYDDYDMEAVNEGGFVTSADVADPARKMIYTANLDIETKQYDDSLAFILTSVANSGGFIETQQESNNSHYYGQGKYGTTRYAYIAARIPSAGFQPFVDSMGEAGQVNNKSIQAENITQRYNDTEATVEALTIERGRLLEMMDKAETIEDMIAVETRLTEVERSLSAYKTDLSAMDKSVEFSTVYISLNEVAEYQEDPETFGQRLAFSIRDSLRNFADGFQDFIIGLIYALPGLLVFALIVFLIILLIRKIRKRNPERAERARQKKEARRQQKMLKKQQKAANAAKPVNAAEQAAPQANAEPDHKDGE